MAARLTPAEQPLEQPVVEAGAVVAALRSARRYPDRRRRDRSTARRQQGGERLVVETLDGQGLVDVEEMVI